MTLDEWLINLDKPIYDIPDPESSRREAEAEMALFWDAKNAIG